MPLAQLAHRSTRRLTYSLHKGRGLPWERPSEAVQEAFPSLKIKCDRDPATEKAVTSTSACGHLLLNTEVNWPETVLLREPPVG